MHDILDIRSRMAAASARIARQKRIDRGAVAVITLGGVAVIASVVGILVFIAWEAVPLFRGATAAPAATTRFDSAALSPASATLRAIGTDEYQRFVYTVEPDGGVVFRDLRTGAPSRREVLPGLAGTTPTSSFRTTLGDFVAVGGADGRAVIAQVRFQPRFEGQVLSGLDISVTERRTIRLDDRARPIAEIGYGDSGDRSAVAGLVDQGEIAVWWIDADGEERRAHLVPDVPERFTRVLVGRPTEIVAGTATGKVYSWELETEPVLRNVSRVGASPVTALEFALGHSTLIVGNAAGEISGWFEARLDESDDRGAKVRVHEFANQGAAVTALAASPRDKSFLSGGRDGSVALRHLTSERTLVEFPRQAAAVAVALITPKSDAALLGLTDGRLSAFTLSNPHPETSLRTLFGKVWYEGYPAPAHVWQSTGATDEFEPKLGLVPLVFGTVKATVYALLFAVPLGVLGALFTSQFAHPSLRSKIKPTIEIMAALPSVVIGFIGGLWLAPLVERHLASVLIAAPLALLFGTVGAVVPRLLPAGAARRMRPGTELAVILPMLLLGGWVAVLVGPALERALFGGDLRLWLDSVGFTYDQRNSLVVGIAMGFAVIPIIFTISDDAFAAVPSSLTAASLALGASRWQTAIRVVVPTASPGVFSAIMIGFGRAIGETMIVLMATGNTPVMDWSIFNGMRTLSANIAVEIMEAPVGGTLYRVLFLSAALLFTMTFVLNTIAELVRQRLRDKYKAI